MGEPCEEGQADESDEHLLRDIAKLCWDGAAADEKAGKSTEKAGQKMPDEEMVLREKI